MNVILIEAIETEGLLVYLLRFLLREQFTASGTGNVGRGDELCRE
jgi:hypothetical protein